MQQVNTIYARTLTGARRKRRLCGQERACGRRRGGWLLDYAQSPRVGLRWCLHAVQTTILVHRSTPTGDIDVDFS